MFTKAYIPYRAYFSSPFSKWQMTLANSHSLELAGQTVARWLASKQLDPKQFDYLYLGYTIHQKQAFYAAPWVAALIGAEGTPGCAVTQACTTSATCLYNSAAGIEAGTFSNVINVLADRMSNGPHIVWPNPQGPGGEVIHENWITDNFAGDPHAKKPMIQTAENVAREAGLTKERCDEVTARRYEQYGDALKEDRSFQKRYMFPVEVAITKKKTVVLAEDEGVVPTTRESLAQLQPATPGGGHSFGCQTHPADAHAALIVTTAEQAREMSADASVSVRIVSYGQTRVEKGMMPKSLVPAAKMALAKAGIGIGEVKVIKTHNPFIANDLYFCDSMGLDPMAINNYGSPLVFGHPQGPTVARCVIELIEELVLRGGGYGLFTGCAAGDTGASLVLKVDC
ncbi:MAG: thiolase family protein [Deltaproteobacteria bacterium]|nr:thiolase family protein [Deltaproteobacteria bacterium]